MATSDVEEIFDYEHLLQSIDPYVLDETLYSDIKPDKQHLVETVIQIPYTDEYAHWFGVFLTLLKRIEKNDKKEEENVEKAQKSSAEKKAQQRRFDKLRIVQLTTHLLAENLANYTCWSIRRRYILKLDIELTTELSHVDLLIRRNLKNYQLWQYRKEVYEYYAQKIIDSGETLNYEDELEFIAQVLSSDAKNYHAWIYRQWVLTTYGGLERELAYVDHLLEEDFRNNSAWHQRFFVLEHTSGFTPDVIEAEVAVALHWIYVAPSNESPYSYIIGLARKINCRCHSAIISGIRCVTEQRPECVPAHAALLELHRLLRDDDAAGLLLIQHLKKIDPTRLLYYESVKAQFSNITS